MTYKMSIHNVDHLKKNCTTGNRLIMFLLLIDLIKNRKLSLDAVVFRKYQLNTMILLFIPFKVMLGIRIVNKMRKYIIIILHWFAVSLLSF